MQYSKSYNHNLEQLVSLLQMLTDEQYSKPLDALSGSSIGKHVRHILEFYGMLLIGYEAGSVCYDLREHNTEMEENKNVALEFIQSLQRDIERKDLKKVMEHIAAVGYGNDEETNATTTTFERELIYVLEHAIHHLAIIKVGIKIYFPATELPEHFGVAYSTVKHLQNECA